jgi:hypothetical protein
LADVLACSQKVLHPEMRLCVCHVILNFILSLSLDLFALKMSFVGPGGALFGSALLYRLSDLAESEEEAELARELLAHSE